MKEQHVTFPKMIMSNWWELRKQAQENPDRALTPKNISQMLKVTVATVYTSIYPVLKHFQLIDKSGNLTERGKRWLDDTQYKNVCNEIIRDIYPDELLNEIKDPQNHREAVKEWFQKKTNSSANLVLQMTATYILLSKGELPDNQDKKPVKEALKAEVRPSTAAPVKVDAVNDFTGNEAPQKRKYTKRAKPEESFNITTSFANESSVISDVQSEPEINININLIITEETSIDKIDSIFSNMAKFILANN